MGSSRRACSWPSTISRLRLAAYDCPAVIGRLRLATPTVSPCSAQAPPWRYPSGAPAARESAAERLPSGANARASAQSTASALILQHCRGTPSAAAQASLHQVWMQRLLWALVSLTFLGHRCPMQPSTETCFEDPRAIPRGPLLAKSSVVARRSSLVARLTSCVGPCMRLCGLRSKPAA